jgi:hypothetical protein
MARHSFHLSIGDIVGKSVGIYFRNLLPFVAISLLVLSPWIALTLYLDQAREDLVAAQHAESGRAFRILGVSFASMLLMTLLSYMMTGAITYGVVQQLRGEPAGMANALTQGLKSFGRVLGTSLLVGLRVILFMLLLYIPGLIELVKLYVALPAAVMEGKSAGAAVQRSIQLTDGSRWTIFASWILLTVIVAGLGALLGVATHMVDRDMLGSPWFQIGVQVVMTPFGATMAAVTYFLLRTGKENVDVKELAAVFD